MLDTEDFPLFLFYATAREPRVEPTKQPRLPLHRKDAGYASSCVFIAGKTSEFSDPILPGYQTADIGSFCFLLAGSLWHKDKWLACTENIYYSRPNAIKNQLRQARNIFNICRKNICRKNNKHPIHLGDSMHGKVLNINN